MGWWEADGGHRDTISLRAPTAEDHLCLAEAADLLQVEQVTLLLDRCIRGAGRDVPSSADLVLGDREALLLHLRRLVLGDHLEVVLTCPGNGCDQMIEIALSVASLLLAPYPHAAPAFTVGARSLRLPTGADQTHAARMAGNGSSGTARWLLERCAGAGAGERDAGVLAATMRELDPQAEIELELECPACGLRFTGILDAGSVVLRELQRERAALLREIHLLASRYHWDERALLRMSARRRGIYLSQLSGAAAGA